MTRLELIAGTILTTTSLFATTYYVNASRPDDSGNGSNWTTAKKTIQAAISLSASNDKIVVTNGIYAPIVLNNRIMTIQSVNGSAVTIIDGGGTNRCATLGTSSSHTNTVLSGFTLRNGLATNANGGGSYYGTLNNCTLTGNKATNGGGSYYGTLNNCTLTGNKATSGGGSSGSTLNNCTLTGNTSATKGGGSSGGTLNNCTLTGNTAATNGGGSSGGTLNNCTLTGNRATEAAGGSYGCTLNNCIVWNNDSVIYDYDNYSSCSMRYSCAFPLPSGVGNISEDPRFTDAANGDFRLRSGSPCIDAGLNAYAVGNFDIIGASRIQNGTVDMGSNEGPVEGFVLSVRLQGVGTVSPMSAVLNSCGTTSFTAISQGRPFVCFMTNGVFASSSPDFTWANITADGVLTALFMVRQWHVDASRPDDSGDGLTWETAKRTLQSAVDISLPGDRVSVADGVYESVTTENKTLTIQSVNGKEAAFIDGGGTNRCATLGMFHFQTNTVLSGFTLRNGVANSGGGSYGGTLNNCTLTGNTATDEGIAAYGGGSYGGTLNNCTLTGNKATDEGSGSSGGGSYYCTLNNCTLTGNSAALHGGGSCDCRLNNCTLTGNSADSGGGSYGGTLNNCTLTGNLAALYGGGSSGGMLNNCTLTGNTADSGGGSSGSSLNNCIIVWNNDSENDDYKNYDGTDIRYSCAFPLPSGVGNISGDPRFTDAANGDFRLRSGSPCIDAGLNAYAVGNVDIIGASRIQNGTVDMGSTEGVVEGFVLSVRLQGVGTVSPMSAVVNSGGTTSFKAISQGRPFVCFMTNGVFASSSPDFTWANITADGVLTARFQAREWHVDAARPDDSGDGLTRETAKRTLQSAVDISLPGDTVSVADGVYESVTTENKTLTIKSVNGKETAFIDGGGTNRCATLGTSRFQTNTVLSCFTLRNGVANSGGGSFGGTLNNCTLTGNTAYYYGGGSYGGTLNNCTLTGNTAALHDGGGSYGGTLNNCTLTGNSADSGGGSSGGTLNNCTLTGNTANYAGGGSYGGTLNNCIVWNNAAAFNDTYNYLASDIRYGCAFPLPAGVGNISGDPRFMNAANGDFRLLSDSPCRDAGNNAFVATSTDMAGQPRIFGIAVDMGAYESVLIFTVSFNTQGGATPAPSSITVTNSLAYGTLATTVKAGYLFDGWYTNTACMGTAISADTIVTLAAVHTLYAKWTPDPYYVAGGTNATPIGITSAVNSDMANSGDGLNSLKLGGIGLLADGQMAGIEWSATGPGILSFDWKVSSEADWDWLRFYEAGIGPTNQISGNVDWSRVSITVTGATDVAHTFRWEYQKDPDGDYVGQDCGWVDAISWMPLYTMTVTNGSGDGYYTNNAYAIITADPPAAHYEFDRWTGDTNTVVNIFAASTTLAMSNTNAIITATYKPILYPLAVSNGSGSGSYSYATSVEIQAASFENKRFYRWTGDVASVADLNAATTTALTTDHSLSLIATYSVPLTVNSGTGSGWYPEGSAANVSADADPLWKEFAVWTGDAGLLANAGARTTTLTVPAAPVSVTATYKDSIARLTGSFGYAYSALGTAGAITPDEGAGSPSGTPAVKLGGASVIPDDGFAAFETVVSGSGSILFSWKVSSESNADYLKFKVDGMQVAAISGTKGPWTQVSNRVESAGSHTLRWEYVKNGSLASSTDAGWVDDIVWIGDVPAPALTPDIIAATVTNSLMALDFIGERGIAYVLQTNATLNTLGWGDWAMISPEYVGETNGVHRFNVAPSMLGHDKMFYRVIGR